MFLDGKKKTISSITVRRRARNGDQLSPRSSATPHHKWQRWPQRPTRKQVGKYDAAGTGFLRFRFSKFRYSLTALSRFFASFPHGTCLLSVSHQYLAFDGIYHPLRAAIPNNSTRTHLFQGPGKRESHPLSCRVPTDLAQPLTQAKPQFGLRRFTWWAIATSVALTEAILVSFFSSA